MSNSGMWEKLKHFRKTENWGSPSKMSIKLLTYLDHFRELINYPFVITSGTQGEHSKNSMHYLGKAVDFVILTDSLCPLDLIINATRFPFTGIGYYPHWEYKGMSFPGFHLDIRPLPSNHQGARWMGVKDESGKQKYVALNEKNLKKYRTE